MYVFYEGLKLWEAHLYVFLHVGEALGGGTMSNGAKRSCEARWVKWDHMSSSGHHVRTALRLLAAGCWLLAAAAGCWLLLAAAGPGPALIPP